MSPVADSYINKIPSDVSNFYTLHNNQALDTFIIDRDVDVFSYEYNHRTAVLYVMSALYFGKFAPQFYGIIAPLIWKNEAGNKGDLFIEESSFCYDVFNINYFDTEK